MTAMSGALDWLAVGDVAEERTTDGLAILGGGAARLAAHAAALGVRTALVAKLGEDDAGRQARVALERLKVELQCGTNPTGRHRVAALTAVPIWRYDSMSCRRPG
jgi:sugar/nucleoside kinase (ribokinase family)